jgi:hypothetical protein
MMRGRYGRTPKRRETFLRLLADGSSVGDACASVDISRNAAYRWRNADPEFRAAWDQAVDHATEIIESVLYNRARDGNLLACIFWLKSHRPAVYNRKQVVQVAGDPDNPVTVDHMHHDGETVHIYMPSNGRDRPERIEIDGEAGEAETDAEAGGDPDTEAA